MIKNIFKLALLLIGLFSFSQKHEIGVQIGMSNLVGDIGNDQYILQTPYSDGTTYGIPFYLGAIYRLNLNPYQTIRFNIGYSNLQFDDSKSNERYKKIRKNYGINTIFHVDTIFEYQFLPINDEQKSLLSPYIFGGIGGMIYYGHRLTIDYRDKTTQQIMNNPSDYKISKKENKNQLSMYVPFGIGLKYKFDYNWNIFGETTFRPTFSNDIDYSDINIENIEISGEQLTKEQKKFLSQKFINSTNVGNKYTKDWINSVTIGISYSFGRPPCYCDK